MMSQESENVLSGPLWRRIISFAWPVAITSMLQQLFCAVDLAALGHSAGASAMAAVGAVLPLLYMNGSIFVGMAIGATVVIAHLWGEGNKEQVAKAVHSALLLALLVGLFICGLDYCGIEPVLRRMGTPPELLPTTLEYAGIFFLAIPFLTMFTFGAAILRAKGETRLPMLCLLVACLTNIILNYLSLQVLQLGVSGIATATVVSQGMSLLLLLVILFRDKSAFGLQWKYLWLDRSLCLKMLRIGLPVVLQGLAYTFSSLIIQTAVNSLGAEAIAAAAVALNYEMLTYFILNSFSQACLAYNGLCYGAGDYERCRQVTRWSLGLNLLVTNLVNAGIIVFAEFFSSLFISDISLYRLVALRLLIVLGLDTINITLETLVAALRGWGQSLLPALICIVGICGGRVIYISTAFKAHPDFSVLAAVYPVTWTITLAVLVVVYRRLRRKCLGL